MTEKAVTVSGGALVVVGEDRPFGVKCMLGLGGDNIGFGLPSMQRRDLDQ